MNSAFFDAVRASVFGGRMTQAQVDGTIALLEAGKRYGVTDRHHMANVLAQVFHETGQNMLGIKETVMPSHKDKNPSDAEVIRRLDRAFAAGQLPWVKTPYWRQGWFGRGPIMLTHENNYRKMGKAIGVDLVANPNLAMDRNIGASIAVVGMRDGMFTGRKLSDYAFPGALDAAVASNPRRIVNGQDGTDKLVADYHRKFHAALTHAGWSVASPAQPSKPKPAPAPSPITPEQPNGSAGAALAIIAAILAAVSYFIFGR
ncbi:glycoside hydrolase family 19 protein [Pelagibacterium luteolum]|uniref:Predicted chitinase n=1 Tax=Pelagibacterium luteolum TaxID=440168 RepID=A0A1G7ZIW8_9HYPH|nr:glycoside hydrolase family 19 protein [Pelagibacterium luteolum]SDH08663.1 Predicted chitinase [Pelagibacterium luteolum]